MPARALPQDRLAPPSEPAPLVVVARSSDTLPAVPPWIHPISSAFLPGTGQLFAGHDRGAIYLAAEAFLAIRYFNERADGTRERERYVDLAFRVARAPFAPVTRDTAFEYFEQMEKFVESGPFDTNPGEALVPPMDTRTFNGSIWELARRTFFEDPEVPPDPQSEEFQRALAFYRERAVGANFRWSWRNAGLEQDLFRQSIRQSDEALRQARQQLGLLLANHLLSALDAFVSNRLSRRGPPVELVTLLSMPYRDGREVRGMFGLRIGI